jgi:uncharacterized delta-60 repeat protein
MWVRTMDGGAAGDDDIRSIAVESTGSVFVTGTLEGLAYRRCGSVKYDATGHPKWIASYDPNPGYTQSGRTIQIGASGGAYVVAASKDSSGTWCYATVRYDSTGAQQWASRYSDSAHFSDYPYGAAVAPCGRIIVTGRSSRNSADSDLATVSYDSGGVEEWVRRYAGPAGRIDYAYAVAVDSSGSAYVAGDVSGDFWEGGVVLKYNDEGTLDWMAAYVPPDEHASFQAIALDPAGNVVVTGHQGPAYTKFLTIKYSPSGDTLWRRLYYRGVGIAIRADGAGNVYVVGTDDQTGSTADIVLLKYDPDGNQAWAARYDGPDQGKDWGHDLALGSDGSVYVCGMSESADFGHECILIKYSASGDTVWTARIRGDGRYGTVGNAVAVDAQGNIIVAGSINKSSTGNDYLVAKYPPSGPGIAESPSRPVPRHGVNVTPSVARSTCLLYGNASSVRHRFLISDVNGRVVRRLSASQPHGVSMQAVWNLDDDSGHQVPNGVYFVTLDAPGQSACAKIVVQR